METTKTLAETTVTRKREELPKHGRLLCLDVGTKTIGLALSDTSQMLASPRTTLKRVKWGQTAAELKAIITQERIAALVIGLPLEMDGTHGASADRAQEVARLCATEFNLPTLLWDERLSTSAAEAALFEQRTGRQTRASKKDVKKDVDAVAAALILQSVLG
jgi:putative Holliday junction resolvase